MRLLLDTHVLLWWLQDNRKLSVPARERIVAASQVYVSSVSIWKQGSRLPLENSMSI
jgi:PIN domain nuclease of toxin-antitoxin system